MQATENFSQHKTQVSQIFDSESACNMQSMMQSWLMLSQAHAHAACSWSCVMLMRHALMVGHATLQVCRNAESEMRRVNSVTY